jgi:hypothetical protein
MNTRILFGSAFSLTLVALAAFAPESSAQIAKPTSPAPAPSLTYAQKKAAAEAAIRGRYACTWGSRYEAPIAFSSHLAGGAGSVSANLAFDLDIQDGVCRVDLARVGRNSSLGARYQISTQNPTPVGSTITSPTCTLTPDGEARPKVDVTFALGPVRVHADQARHAGSGTSTGISEVWLNERGELMLTFYFDAPATMNDNARYMGTTCKRLP